MKKSTFTFGLAALGATATVAAMGMASAPEAQTRDMMGHDRTGSQMDTTGAVRAVSDSRPMDRSTSSTMPHDHLEPKAGSTAPKTNNNYK